MKWCERILLFLFLGICLGIMSEGTLWAGDCASPGDCGAVPDNGSRAAAAGAAAAGGGLAWRSHNKNKNKSKKKGGSPSPPGKPDPCASQKSAMTQAQSTANMYQSQMDTYQQAINADKTAVASDQSAANSAYATLQSDLSGNLGAYIAENLQGWPSDPSQFTSSQLQQVQSTFGSGPWSQQVSEFVAAVQQLHNDMAKLNNDSNLYDQAKQNQQTAQQAADQASKDFWDCVAAHPADDTSSGYGQAAPLGAPPPPSDAGSGGDTSPE